MSDRKAKALVREAIRVSFGGRLTPGSIIRNFTLNGEPIPDFRIDSQGNVELLPAREQ